MEALIYLAFTALELIALGTAQWLIRLVGAGHWQSEGIRSEKYRIHSGAGALSYQQDGRRVVTVQGQRIIGLVFYALLAGAGICWLS